MKWPLSREHTKDSFDEDSSFDDMPLTDLHNISLFRVLRYTARFGLNRSQGTYFYHTMQKSPPGTYLADLKHVSQPSSTSLLGRLLREACGTLPHLVPQELVYDNSQSRRRVSCDIEMKHGPSGTTELPREASVSPSTIPSDQKAVEEPVQSPVESSMSNGSVSPEVITLIRGPTSTPPATQPSFTTLPAQLQPLSIPSPEAPLWSADTYQYSHPCWTTNTRSPLITPIDSGNLPPQYLHFHTNESFEPIQQDDMDCLPPSPLPSSDVDMDILTDTTPAPPSYDHIPWTQWIQVSEYAESPLSANQSSPFLASAPLYAPSFHAVTNMHWDAERNNLPWDTLAPAAEPWVDLQDPNSLPTYHPGPLGSINATSDQIQDTGIRWQEQPHRGGTPHLTSITALLEEFERSLTLVADETSSSEVDRIALDSISDVGENILHDSPFERKAAESLGEGIDQTLACFLNLNNPPPPPLEQESIESIGKIQDQPPGDPPTVRFEREATEPLEQDECQPPTPTLDQPRRPLDPVSLPPDAVPGLPVTRPSPHFAHPFVHPRAPTPPPARSRRKSERSYGTRTNQHTTRQSAVHLATLNMKRLSTNAHQDRADLAQAIIQASKQAQSGGGMSLQPLPAWYGTREREEEDEDEVEVRPAGGRRGPTKQTRFVMPNADDDTRKDLAARPRRTRGVVKAMDPTMSTLAGSKNTRRTTVTGPPRSILRNARATAVPYQKAAARHAGRRASVP